MQMVAYIVAILGAAVGLYASVNDVEKSPYTVAAMLLMASIMLLAFSRDR